MEKQQDLPAMKNGKYSMYYTKW